MRIFFVLSFFAFLLSCSESEAYQETPIVDSNTYLSCNGRENKTFAYKLNYVEGYDSKYMSPEKLEELDKKNPNLPKKTFLVLTGDTPPKIYEYEPIYLAEGNDGKIFESSLYPPRFVKVFNETQYFGNHQNYLAYYFYKYGKDISNYEDPLYFEKYLFDLAIEKIDGKFRAFFVPVNIDTMSFTSDEFTRKRATYRNLDTEEKYVRTNYYANLSSDSEIRYRAGDRTITKYQLNRITLTYESEWTYKDWSSSWGGTNKDNFRPFKGQCAVVNRDELEALALQNLEKELFESKSWLQEVRNVWVKEKERLENIEREKKELLDKRKI